LPRAAIDAKTLNARQLENTSRPVAITAICGHRKRLNRRGAS
jgi:hypothetical protein